MYSMIQSTVGGLCQLLMALVGLAFLTLLSCVNGSMFAVETKFGKGTTTAQPREGDRCANT